MKQHKATLKSNIAIIIPGGIGTGSDNIGIPVLERIIKLLSVDFNLTVFQLYRVNKNFTVKGFELIDLYSSNPVFKSIKFLFVFWRIHRQRRFQVVHGFWAMPCGFLAVLIGKVFGIKSIVSVLGGDAIALPKIQYGQLRSPLNRKLILWTLRQANEVTLLTQYLVDNLRRYSLTRTDVKVIPWGIDTALFSFTGKSLSDPVQFLHIANLHPVKDQETLLSAFKIISDKISAQLTIIGEGILEDHVMALIAQLDLQDKITLRGLLPYKELPSYYQKADVLLHTSLSEGQCEVITEAMSCGVLVCGTNVGLLYDLPDCCIAVPIGDYDMLASSVLQALKDSISMERMKKNAAEWTKAHSMLWTVEKISELYASPSNP